MVLFVEKQSYTCYTGVSVLNIDHGKDVFNHHSQGDSLSYHFDTSEKYGAQKKVLKLG